MFCSRISYLYKCHFFLAQEDPGLQICLLSVAGP